ncbi:CHAT domain-containing protein [Catellatospora paridis]|uniref:CHAT domain-containing protein n=1 Tax=Catellatospora paridis TaxID=1617086 RepID=UPI0012D46C95|nr:CHAT domain-containing protein [Catellatospora paridis]
MKYQNFDLEIQADRSAYTARVTASPAGQSAGITRFELSFDEFSSQVDRIALRPGANRAGLPSLHTSVRDLGAALFTRIFQQTVYGCYERSLGAIRDEHGMRIRLDLSAAPALAPLPWELLYDPDRRRYLNHNTATPVIRFLPAAESERRIAIDQPVRILAVISNPEGDEDVIDVAAETALLQRAVAARVETGDIRLEILQRAALPDLHDKMMRFRPHVLHFIGHGRYNRKEVTGELLLFHPGEDRGVWHRADDFAAVLLNFRELGLVVLNSCEAGRADIRDPFAGVAQTLLLQQVPTAISMQFGISDDACRAFTQGLYESLAEGDSIEEAITTARIRIFAGANPIEWLTPVLYSRHSAESHLLTSADPTTQTARGATIVSQRPQAGSTTGAGRQDTPRGTVLVEQRLIPGPRPPAAVDGSDLPRKAPRHTAPPGRVRSWGDTTYGQAHTPTDVADVTQVAAGTVHTAALHTDGTVTIWGGTRGSSDIRRVGFDMAYIAAGGDRTLAIRRDRTLTGWDRTGTLLARLPKDAYDIVAVAAGRAHNMALRADGTVLCWPAAAGNSATPPDDCQDVVAIAAGTRHMLALRQDGTVLGWGDNRHGQVHVPRFAQQIVGISAGGAHSLAVDSDGRLHGWGRNDQGQFGPLHLLTDVKAVAAGDAHALILTVDGRVKAYGSNGNGQCDIPAMDTPALAIAAGTAHSVVTVASATTI